MEDVLFFMVVMLWLAGGYVTYTAGVEAGRIKPSKTGAITASVVWPFVVLFVAVAGKGGGRG